MRDIERAIEIVRKAEEGLRELMQQALTAQRYGDVGGVAPLADALAELLRFSVAAGPGSLTSKSGIGSRGSSVLSPTAVGGGAKPTVRDDDYPRFERDGDKLVKIAWSKKDKREYEHRAPRATVLRVAEILSDSKTPGSAFAMDKLMPFKLKNGDDIPSYQAYLALAWFRALGVVEQRGKDGYAMTNGALDRARVEDAWRSVRSRA